MALMVLPCSLIKMNVETYIQKTSKNKFIGASFK